MTVGLAHWLTVVDVVLDVVVTVVLVVLVVVGPGAVGATIVSWKLPLRPFQPSTTMK